MRRLRFVLALVALVVATSAYAADSLFDPNRDPAADLKAAEAKARQQHKNILMDVGGDWCVWCRLLDQTFATDDELHALLTKNYIVLHVNMSKENENKAFLSQYAKAAGYPAWYVLSPDGKVLKAEDTSELEATHRVAAGYNKESLKAFLQANAPTL